MGKYWNGREITEIFYGKILVEAVYKGAKLIWSGLASAFSSGFWRGDKPWIGSGPWKG